MRPRAHVAGQLREQALWCAELGSPLYAHLLEKAAGDVEGGGPTWAVLAGQAAGLVPYYPSVGGESGTAGAWKAFRDLVAERAEVLRSLVSLPCQTNEVGRCAPLAFGFFRVAVTTGLPLRLLELGASAGLNLRWDHYRYGGGGATWGEASSPVDLAGLWQEAPPRLPATVEVVERSGCDLRPLDPARAHDRLALEASVWADHTARLRRLRGAFEVAHRVPARVEAASLAEWLPPQLARHRVGVATIVYHSIVEEYLKDDDRAARAASLAEAGARARPDAPLAWLRFEPLPGRTYGVTVTTWPGGEERLVARSGAHGTEVRRASRTTSGPGRGPRRSRPGGRRGPAA